MVERHIVKLGGVGLDLNYPCYQNNNLKLAEDIIDNLCKPHLHLLLQHILKVKEEIHFMEHRIRELLEK